jgi:hypothetical protein
VDDPKKRVGKTSVLDEGDTEDLREQVASLQQTVQLLLAQKSNGIDADALEAIMVRVAKISAEAQERAANPSNKQHPHISVFSYPEGDIANPRPALKCPMFWVGYPIDHDTNTAEEIELFNLAEPGEYSFTRLDGSKEKLTVEGQTDASGKLVRLLFTFLTSERRDSLPSMSAILRDAFKVKTPEQLELEKLRAEVEALRASA